MRLSEREIRTIVGTVREFFGAAASVRLFGSRLDDSLRGGDIDLAIKVEHVVDRPVEQRAMIAAMLQRRLEGRSVDVVLIDPASAGRGGIYARALSDGVALHG
jgi:predicted nucleotidyltransferase